MQAIVMYSGGVGSWAAGMRTVERYGVANTTLLFADTMMEDEDLYRFLHEGAEIIGVPVTRIADGRTPWEVFHDERYLGNTRADPCSRILKRQMCDSWVKERYAPDECIRLVGMDSCQRERVRLAKIQQACAPYQTDAPLLWDSPLDKDMAKFLALKHGLKLPRLYDMGFPHNNCGGFCVKAGQASFALLYRAMPERYRWHEKQEEGLRIFLRKDVSIMRDRMEGKTKPLTMHSFRERQEKEGDLFQPGWGMGDDEQCNCFFGDEHEESGKENATSSS